MFKALLFLCVGVGIHTVFGTQDFRRFRSITSTQPGPSALISVANLALLGFPFLAGFYRKDSILEGFYRAAQRLSGLVAFLMGVGLTAAYRFKLTRLALLGSLDPAPATLNGGGTPPKGYGAPSGVGLRGRPWGLPARPPLEHWSVYRQGIRQGVPLRVYRARGGDWLTPEIR